jgi:hypothetical protein
MRCARDRKRRETGKCEGLKSHVEKRPGALAMAKKLHRANPSSFDLLYAMWLGGVKFDGRARQNPEPIRLGSA